MSKLKNRKVVVPLVVVLVVIAFIAVMVLKGDSIKSYKAKYEGTNLDEEVEGISKENTYASYLTTHKDAATPETEVDVDIFDYTNNSQGVSVQNNIGEEAKVLRTDEKGVAEWKVNVPQSGFYNIKLEYYPEESRGISIERKILINGEMPFSGSDALSFSRVWSDADAVKQDNRGNDIRPTQVEVPTWQSMFLRDYMGYYTEPYKFYLEAGANTIALEGVNEPLIIRKLTLCNQKTPADYKEYTEKVDASAYQNANRLFQQVYQGESNARRSSPSLYATSDRTSTTTEPYSIKTQKLNITGGTNWKVAGDWIEWDIEVPDDGFYTVGLKARQSYNRGFVSNRAVYIDGEIPFDNLSKVQFTYSSDWKMTYLADEKGEAYKFPLKAGKHTIRLEVTLGDLGDILNELNDSVFRLNKMYRKILVLTGAEPDKYRDYKIDSTYPEVMEGMKLEAKHLYKIVDELVAYAGQNGSQVSTALALANQLERFVKRPDKIPATMTNFKTNISALGTSVLTLSESPLDIDYIVVSAPEAPKKKVTSSFFAKALHEVKIFFTSFVIDYNSIGSTYADGKNTIDVWILSGRDQSNALKSMIDDTFTPESGINVNVKLVESNSTNVTAANTLLSAVVADTGPDVAISVAQTEPVNYALRNAAIDLKKLEGIDEVLSEYKPSSYKAYEFNGGLYALPETQNWNVMFYRTDILNDELGLQSPDTWQELIEMLPVIQKNNMEVGIPSVERKIGNTTNPDLANYYAQLYQRGGQLYSDDAKKVTIDSEAGIEAFEFYTKFFTNYKLPKQYDFVNRFRTGEMPLGIADYSNYNTLSVFAPEIRGLWEFDLIPGVEQEDGTINRATQSWGTCSMMVRTVKNKDASWKFMKWWANSDTQTRFGRELEAVMGAAARYATANTVSFDQLSWSSEDAAVLKEQWEYAFGLPEVAGGYYTPRHIVNAIRKVMNDNEDPRETLLDYVLTINKEIRNKRIEFGLPVSKDDTLEG